MRTITFALIAILTLGGCTTPTTNTPANSLRWTRQFGTSSNDVANGIATDANRNVYVAGGTVGTLEGTSAGSLDAFIRSYDQSGTLRWTRQFGTIGVDNVVGIATDANGNLYVAGITVGALEGDNAGGWDAFIRSYDQSGALRWTRQFGTNRDDFARGIATDANGNVYVSGDTFGDLDGANAGINNGDAFIRSYSQNGGFRWASQFGTSGDEKLIGIATDATGNVYATGTTDDALEGSNAGGFDAFIRSYTQGGGLRWTRQYGTSGNDLADDIATDTSDNVYATGTTDGVLAGTSAGGTDVFIRSFNQSGALRWTRQFGTAVTDRAWGIAADASGNVVATGFTFGDLDGTNAGSNTTDAFIRSYDESGTLLWARQFGTSANDFAQGIATDADGNIYASGYTDGTLEGTNAGGNDAFIRSYDP